jgi:sterol desaturase/sphingolipid hydroxylase (fatty acid hydroxylase superfamily)
MFAGEIGSDVSLTPVKTPAASHDDRRIQRAVFGWLCLYLTVLVGSFAIFETLGPDQFDIHVLGRHILLCNLHSRLLHEGPTILLITPTIFAAELWLVGWSNSSLYRLTAGLQASSKTDIVYFLSLHAGIIEKAGVVLTFGLTLFVAEHLRDSLFQYSRYQISITSLPVFAQVAVFVLVYSFFDYWQHRIDHHRIFWPLHRYHHAAEDFCTLNSSRVHPAAFSSALMSALIIILMKVSTEALIDANLMLATLRLLVHSRIDSDFGWVGRYVIQSPRHHRLHHILDMSRPIGHFGLVPIWDHLFGTWRRSDIDQTLPIGVSTPYQHGAWIGADIWRDYCDFCKAVASTLRPTAGQGVQPAPSPALAPRADAGTPPQLSRMLIDA